MRVLTKLGLFGLALAVLFAGGLGAGRAFGPASADPGAGQGSAASHGSGNADDAVVEFPKGLQVAEGGYRLVLEQTVLRPGRKTDFRFSILGPRGKPVTEYAPTHEKELHLIVARRDLTGFWHVHPILDADGVWEIPLTLPDAGAYRAFADFQPEGTEEPLTLGADLTAPGRVAARPLPAAARTAQVDGYEVELSGNLIAGKANPVTLRVTKDGRPVTDLQPYLGAYGHLVALRAGDLAYLHVHPTEGDKGGPEIGFAVEAPSAGAYRLFLDFKHGGEVRTAAFTIEAESAGTPKSEPSTPGGHDDHSD